MIFIITWKNIFARVVLKAFVLFRIYFCKRLIQLYISRGNKKGNVFINWFFICFKCHWIITRSLFLCKQVRKSLKITKKSLVIKKKKWFSSTSHLQKCRSFRRIYCVPVWSWVRSAALVSESRQDEYQS